jgi:hypothetical protein
MGKDFGVEGEAEGDKIDTGKDKDYTPKDKPVTRIKKELKKDTLEDKLHDSDAKKGPEPKAPVPEPEEEFEMVDGKEAYGRLQRRVRKMEDFAIAGSTHLKDLDVKTNAYNKELDACKVDIGAKADRADIKALKDTVADLAYELDNFEYRHERVSTYERIPDRFSPKALDAFEGNFDRELKPETVKKEIFLGVIVGTKTDKGMVFSKPGDKIEALLVPGKPVDAFGIYVDKELPADINTLVITQETDEGDFRTEAYLTLPPEKAADGTKRTALFIDGCYIPSKKQDNKAMQFSYQKVDYNMKK